jgi:hypothetical protein
MQGLLGNWRDHPSNWRWLSSMTAYTVVLDDEGAFAVEMQAADGRRELFSGFKTEEEARTWMIARQGAGDPETSSS